MPVASVSDLDTGDAIISIILEISLTPARRPVISRLIERTDNAIPRQNPAWPVDQLDIPAPCPLLRVGHSLGQLPLMDGNAAVTALGALAQEHRLALFRLLVQAGADGLPAGVIAEKLGVPNSSLSFHLAQLRTAGLITQERQHRSLIYRANYPAMNALLDYLTENCCAGAECPPAAIPSQPTRKSA